MTDRQLYALLGSIEARLTDARADILALLPEEVKREVATVLGTKVTDSRTLEPLDDVISEIEDFRNLLLPDG